METTLNTTDEGSRGMSPKDFVDKSEWIKGPDFLKEPEESWLKEEKYEEHVDAELSSLCLIHSYRTWHMLE